MDLQDKIEKLNQNGDERDGVPSDKLKNPPQQNRTKKMIRKSGHNSTAKDVTNQGQRT